MTLLQPPFASYLFAMSGLFRLHSPARTNIMESFVFLYLVGRTPWNVQKVFNLFIAFSTWILTEAMRRVVASFSERRLFPSDKNTTINVNFEHDTPFLNAGTFIFTPWASRYGSGEKPWSAIMTSPFIKTVVHQFFLSIYLSDARPPKVSETKIVSPFGVITVKNLAVSWALYKLYVYALAFCSVLLLCSQICRLCLRIHCHWTTVARSSESLTLVAILDKLSLLHGDVWGC